MLQDLLTAENIIALTGLGFEHNQDDSMSWYPQNTDHIHQTICVEKGNIVYQWSDGYGHLKTFYFDDGTDLLEFIHDVMGENED